MYQPIYFPISPLGGGPINSRCGLTSLVFCIFLGLPWSDLDAPKWKRILRVPRASQNSSGPSKTGRKRRKTKKENSRTNEKNLRNPCINRFIQCFLLAYLFPYLPTWGGRCGETKTRTLRARKMMFSEVSPFPRSAESKSALDNSGNIQVGR